MSQRQLYPFRTIRGSSAPSFSAGTTTVFVSTSQLFESTALNRMWAGPMRTVRIAEKDGTDSYIQFGSSLVEANSSDSMLFLGGTVEAFHIEPGQKYIAVNSTVGVVLNVTLGVGG